jgi:predicted metal-dependent enzyme (double-stranded beta helix superfamily)
MSSLHRYADELAAFAAGHPGDPAALARAAADALPMLLADPDLLSPAQRRPSEDGYTQHVLHADPDGRFSVVALVWGPGQATPPHDHVAWCVVGVYQGEEEETVYRTAAGPAGPRLTPVVARRHRAGDIVWLVPEADGDVHRVVNPTSDTAISVHVYGADLARLGSSIKRRYPVPEPA